MDELNYQRARRLRGASLSKLIAEQLAEGAGVGESISGAIKLKTRARIKGIKEKFDPLNVIKFITGSQTLAPALLGKFLGRSKRDIQYFSQGLRNLPALTKIGKDPSQDRSADFDGVNEMLKKIYSFMLASQQKEIKMRELENNRLEEKIMEDERRHKLLMDALLKMKKQPVMVEKIVTEKTKSVWETIFESVIGRAALSLLTNPLAMAALSAIVALYYQTQEGGQKTSESVSRAGDIAETSKQIIESTEDVVQARRNRILSERTGNEWSPNPFKDSDLQKKYLEKIGWDENTGTTRKEREQGAIGLDSQGNLIKIGDQKSPKQINPKSNYLTPQEAPETVPGDAGSSVNINTQLLSSVPTAPSGQNSMFTALNENLNLKLQEDVFNMTPKEKSQKDFVIGQSEQETNFERISIPSVRNQEETLSQVIFERTYVV